MDGTPIRDFKNLESRGVGFPTNQPMWIYSSHWNADDWATQGGRVKADWSKVPFTTSYRNFNAQTSNIKPASTSVPSGGAWYNQELDSLSHKRLNVRHASTSVSSGGAGYNQELDYASHKRLNVKPTSASASVSSGGAWYNQELDSTSHKRLNANPPSTSVSSGGAGYNQEPDSVSHKRLNVKPASASVSSGGAWYNQELDSVSHKRLRWVQSNFKIYNYCTDRPRFPHGLPIECSVA